MLDSLPLAREVRYTPNEPSWHLVACLKEGLSHAARLHREATPRPWMLKWLGATSPDCSRLEPFCFLMMSDSFRLEANGRLKIRNNLSAVRLTSPRQGECHIRLRFPQSTLSPDLDKTLLRRTSVCLTVLWFFLFLSYRNKINTPKTDQWSPPSRMSSKVKNFQWYQIGNNHRRFVGIDGN